MMETRPTRRSFSREFKLRVIKYFYEHQNNNLVTANHFNINRKQVRCWVRDEWKFHDVGSRTSPLNNNQSTSSINVEMEKRLFQEFCDLDVRGISVKRTWFLTRAAEILAEIDPNNHDPLSKSLTPTWFDDFKKRFRIYFKRDPVERIRLPPTEAGICMLLSLPLSCILPLKASVQLTIFLDGVSRVRPLLLFGAQEPPISLEERDSYDPRTRVMFQQHAETDEEILLEWIHSEWETSMGFYLGDGRSKVIFTELPDVPLCLEESLKPSFSYLKPLPPGSLSNLFILNEAVRKPFLSRLKEEAINKSEDSPRIPKEERIELSRVVGDAWALITSEAEELRNKLSEFTVLNHLCCGLLGKEDWNPNDLNVSLGLDKGEAIEDEDGEGEYFIDCDPI